MRNLRKALQGDQNGPLLLERLPPESEVPKGEAVVNPDQSHECNDDCMVQGCPLEPWWGWPPDESSGD